MTPPLWGHSLGVFSQVMTLAAPGEVAAEIEDANLRVDTIEVDELANPDARIEMPEVAVSEAMISANDELLESQIYAEPQGSEVAEEAWDDETQTDLASLRLGDSAFEIPPFEPEAEIHAAEQPSLLAISRFTSPARLNSSFIALTPTPSTRGSTHRSSAEFDDSPCAGGSSADSPQRRWTFVWPSCELY